jgi:predicted RNA-binding Zn ribbon-like protein
LRYADLVATRIAIMPLDEVVRLVNKWGTLPRRMDGRSTDPADPELTTLADELHPIFAAGTTRAAAEQTPTATAREPHISAAEPANATAPVATIEAGSTQKPVEERAARVTALLELTGVRPVLTVGDDGRLVQAWLVEDPGQARRAAAALALREQLADRPGRIGVCADRQCADVYVDLSPAARRRFCCLTCQNRARAEAFRKRRAAG